MRTYPISIEAYGDDCCPFCDGEPSFLMRCSDCDIVVASFGEERTDATLHMLTEAKRKHELKVHVLSTGWMM